MTYAIAHVRMGLQTAWVRIGTKLSGLLQELYTLSRPWLNIFFLIYTISDSKFMVALISKQGWNFKHSS